MENLTWKIDNSKINIEIAKWIIETIDHVKFRESLNLLHEGVYRTYSEDMLLKLNLHETGYVVIIDIHSNIIHFGMFHILCDKLRDLYPSLRSL